VSPAENRWLITIDSGQIDQTNGVDDEALGEWIIRRCLRIDAQSFAIQRERVEICVVIVTKEFDNVERRNLQALNTTFNFHGNL
jgi:hypothetical protein